MTKETKDSDGKAKDFIPPPPPPPTDVPVLTEPYMKVEEAQKM